MIRLNAGDSRGCCDALSRRSFLQLGAAGALALPELLRARDASAAANGPAKDTRVPRTRASSSSGSKAAPATSTSGT
jgi:hypothetical protein